VRWDEPMNAPTVVRQEREEAERKRAFAELRAWAEEHLDEIQIVSVGKEGGGSG